MDLADIYCSGAEPGQSERFRNGSPVVWRQKIGKMCRATEQKQTYFPSTAATTLHAILCSYSALSIRSRRSFRLFKFIMNTYMGGDSSKGELSDFWWRLWGSCVQREETDCRRGHFWQTSSSIFTSLLTSSKPILSGCFLGTRMYLEGITGGFRTAR